jgi:16S rRNA (cytosine967-C5)-methyltransferase
VVAAGIVGRWLETGEFPDRLLEAVERDRGFITEVVFGTVKRRRVLDFLLRQVAPRVPEPPLRAHLLTGIYQLWLMREPGYAVVNETVSAVQALFSARQAGFVNAVLRRVIRERPALEAALAAQPLALRLSHPDALADRWIPRHGAGAAARLFEWDNQPPPLVLRLNPAQGPMSAFLAALAEAGHEATPHPFGPDRFCVLARGADVRQLPGYDGGRFMVQDPSTVAAVDLLAPQPGESVLDACAAPGGKTLAMAECMAGAGRLMAMDLHADRLPPLRENLVRLRQTWVAVVEGDVRTLPPEAAGPWDAILLDVPCSNTGVLRRRPDARWRFTVERMKRLVETQQGLLEAAAGAVAAGGRLVYSTCSLEPEEGETLVRDWLTRHPAFGLEAERRLFPPVDGVDGAYAARLRRRSSCVVSPDLLCDKPR